MRDQRNLIVFAAITILTVFSMLVVWPGWPKRYLPDFIDYPTGPLLDVGRDAMRLGLDLQGGTYVLVEADISTLPEGTNVDDAMNGAKDIIERRINAFGTAETEVTREGKNRLSIQLPGIPPDEAAQLIGKTALLEFRQPILDEQRNIRCSAADGTAFVATPQQVGEGVGANGEKIAQCIVGQQVGEVQWEPATAQDSQGQTRILTGRFIKPNGAQVNPVPQPVVQLAFTGEGGLLFEQVTTRLVNYPLGIFLDDQLISAPNVRQAISGGQTVIEGFTLDEAKTLAIQLNAGALPVPLHTIQTTEVDATLGENTLVRAVQAGIIGVLAVMAFMVLYYRLPGLLASAALMTYISTVMMIFKLGPIIGPVTITLAGIAGFVLSIGMAVDANILVFERMKEELRAGRSLASAVEHGFDRAWSSIRDSNVSTLITCVILWWFGDQFGASLVKGFALTLGLGVLVSMFSALVVTRTLLRLLVGTPMAQHLRLFAPDLGAPAAPRPSRPFVFDFVKRRGFYFALSSVILVPGIISLLISPSLKPGIEFSSGATFTLDFADDTITQKQVHDVFAGLGHHEARVQKTSGGDFIIRVSELKGPTGPPVGAAPPSERDEIEAALEASLGSFTTKNFNQVSEIVSREIARNAAIAIGFASLAILVYISYSFRNVPKAYRYGIAAVVAALHDAVFILGAFSIFGKVFGIEINTMFITGLLTVIGFSVHDTIVVFDRIRENVTQNPNAPFDEVVNASLTETVARSINTSATVLLTVISLLLLGTGDVDVLLLALLLGIVAGTYSSIFIASQILVAWEDGDFARIFRRIVPRRQAPAAAEA